MEPEDMAGRRQYEEEIQCYWFVFAGQALYG